MTFDVYYTTPDGRRGKALGIDAETAAEAMQVVRDESPELIVTSARRRDYLSDD